MAKNEIKYLTAIKQEKRPKKYCVSRKWVSIILITKTENFEEIH